MSSRFNELWDALVAEHPSGEEHDRHPRRTRGRREAPQVHTGSEEMNKTRTRGQHRFQHLMIARVLYDYHLARMAEAQAVEQLRRRSANASRETFAREQEAQAGDRGHDGGDACAPGGK